jgi:tape measure domain-containing protein
MAKLKDLKVTIGLSKRGLTKLNSDLRRTKSNFRRNFGEISNLAKKAGTMIATGVAAGLTAVIKSGADLEKLRVGFRSITGSAEGASKMVDKLNKFTAQTPFQLEEVSRSARQLMAVGVGVEDINDRLRMLGDIAAASGNSISDITAVFAKVQAKGKVELESLNQLAERGIPIFDQLRKVTGDANMEFGAGKVSVDEFNEALLQMHSEGGFANDAMINLSETVSGRLTTAFDNITLALGNFAEKSGLLSAVSGVLEDFTTQLQRASLSEDDLQKSREQFYDLRQKLKKAHKGNIEDLMLEAQAAQKLAFTLNQVLGEDVAGGHLKGANAFVDKVEELFAFSTTSLSTLPDAPPETGGDNENNVRPQIEQVERGIRVHAKSAKEIENHALQNRKLKGSYTDLSNSLQPVLNKFHELGAVVGQQLPSFFEGAFTSLMEGTKSFGQFMLQTLQRLLIKAAALAATFVVLSVILGGATGVAEMTGGKAGLGAFMKMGMGVPQMAEGGMFTGASLAMVGEGPGTSSINPEVVAPLDKLKNMIGGGNVNVTGTIRGRDLLLSEERSSYSRRRRFGK